MGIASDKKMGKFLKILLNSLFISLTTADYFEITSCNDDASFPAMSMKITREYFEMYLSEETDLFELSPDGAFYERTIAENDLALSFDSNLDEIILSYTLMTTSSSLEINDGQLIRFAQENIDFQCRYARRVVSAISYIEDSPIYHCRQVRSVDDDSDNTPPARTAVGNGALTYNMDIVAGDPGGN